jgi:hypothetical protein
MDLDRLMTLWDTPPGPAAVTLRRAPVTPVGTD